jgi:hypothetical protein
MHAFQHGMLEVTAIVRHFVRDPIDNDRIRVRFVHPGAAEFDELCGHAGIAVIHCVQKFRRERPLAPAQEAHFFHDATGILVLGFGFRVSVFNRVRRGTSEFAAPRSANRGRSHPIPGGHCRCLCPRVYPRVPGFDAPVCRLFPQLK